MRSFKATVVIPLYNKGAEINRCLRSVFELTPTESAPAPEVVLVDDGSTDGGASHIAKPYRDRIRTCRITNQGPAKARNIGAAQSRTPWLIFLDADDALLPGALGEYARLAADFPEASVLCAAHLKQNCNGRLIRPRGTRRSDFRSYIRDFPREYTFNRGLINSSSVAIHRDAFSAVGGFPEGQRIGEDVFLWLHLAERYSFAHSGETVSVIKRSSTNTLSKTEQPREEAPYFLKYYLAGRGVNGVGKLSPRSLQMLLLWLAILTLRNASQNRRPALGRAVLELPGWRGTEKLLLRSIALALTFFNGPQPR
jgi:glycosyltransferase involved in cell wall biosynthesis